MFPSNKVPVLQLHLLFLFTSDFGDLHLMHPKEGLPTMFLLVMTILVIVEFILRNINLSSFFAFLSDLHYTKFSSIIQCFFDVLWVGSIKTPPFVDILNLMELFCNFLVSIHLGKMGWPKVSIDKL